jgi:AraC family transcriptional regulator, positive regulator of tynA and feaB
MWQSWSTTHTARNRADFWSDVVAHGVVHAEMRAKDQRRFSGTLASRTVGGARFVSFRTAAHRVTRNALQAAHGEAHVMVSLQCRGVSQIAQGARTLTLQAAEVAVLDSARPFTIEFPIEVERRLVLLPRRLLEPWLPQIADGPVLLPSRSLCNEIVREAIMRVTNTERTWSDSDCISTVEALCHLLRGAFAVDDTNATVSTPAPLQIAAIKRELKRRLHEHSLTPAVVARTFRISLRTLHRLFEAEGHSFTRYLQSERLGSARALIERGTPGLTLTQIALDCGFGDAAHFSRSYRAHFGEAPRDTRERARRASLTAV